MSRLADYRAFLEAKIVAPVEYGAPVDVGAVNPICKPHQAAIIRWAVQGGRRAIFAKFGLGKTVMQLEVLRLTLEQHPGRALIIAPLGVRQEFMRDAAMLGISITFIRTTDEIQGDGIYLTNYESVREGKIDVSRFIAVSLDEASVLRGFGGTKTFREFMATIAGDDRAAGVRTSGIPYRFVATATPSPNEYLELASYAAFLGVMDVGEVKTRFFKRDSEKADKLTLYPHKEEEFWLWVNTWSVFLQSPADLGFPADGYELPPLTVNWHTVSADHTAHAGFERDGQAKLLRDSAIGVQDASVVKRQTMGARVAKVRELVDARPRDHVIIWHDLEDERRALEAAIPDLVTVYGSQDLDERETTIRAFADGSIARIGAKPVMLGSGVNFQRHCHWAIFAGIGFKFNDFIQACHRVYRYGQTGPVTIDIIFADAEIEVRRALEAKWQRHERQMERMTAIIREYGLNAIGAHERLKRTIGASRAEDRGETWVAVNNDCVEETMAMPSDSVGLVVTSIPFGTQYEYSPSYNDFGHTDDDDHFFAQMDFLAPELFRVLKPGRLLCVHVKDRIRPGGLDGRSFQSVSPFSSRARLYFLQHGFADMGFITIATDVVRENNQTYRLGYTEQCKDGSKMGVGLPEYALLFRKPPTDSSLGYADERVVKAKSEYSIARWQIDAHANWRSNGNRLLAPSDLVGRPAEEVFRLFRAWSSTQYDYAQHVAMGEALAAAKQLPSGFMLLQPASNIDDVWTDVTRMRTLNGAQYAAGKELHLCPLQFDIVDRLIARYSNPGDVVYDPFGGLGTVAIRAVESGRRGLTVELNTGYWADSVWYLRRADEKRALPTLFDMLDAVEGAA